MIAKDVARPIVRSAVSSSGTVSNVPIIKCDWFAILSASILNYSAAGSREREEIVRFAQQLGVPDDAMPTIDTTYSVAGWTANNYINALPQIIEDASEFENPVVLVHGFGNDVTNSGPFPGGAQQYRANMQLIVQTLQDAGIRVLLSSLSYRVPPGSNPSAPYNLHINEPLIRRFTPWCWDDQEGRPVCDMYDFTRYGNLEFYDDDNVHPNQPGQQRIRGYLGSVIARLILGKHKPTPGREYMGKRFVFSFGTNLTMFDGINPVIASEIGGSATTDGAGSAWGYSIVATDGAVCRGPHVEAAFHSNRNTDGRGGSGRDANLQNGTLLSASIFSEPAGEANGNQPYIEFANLPNGLTGTLRLTASRNTGANDRIGNYRIVSGAPTDRADKQLDAAADPPEVIEWPITVNEGRIRIEYDCADGNSFVYVGGIELEFDDEPFAVIDTGIDPLAGAAIINGGNGAFFDMMDAGAMFQDEDGTVPVERFGDPVVRINSQRSDVYAVAEGSPGTVTNVNGQPVLQLDNNRYRLRGLDPAFARPVIAHGTYQKDDSADVLYWYNNSDSGYGGRKWGAFVQPGQYRMFFAGGNINVYRVDSWQPYHDVYHDRPNDRVIIDGVAESYTMGEESYDDDDLGFSIGAYTGEYGESYTGMITYFAVSDTSLDQEALESAAAQRRSELGID